VPIAAAAMILWLLSTLALREMLATLVFVTFTALVYYARYTRMKPLNA
jgi:hypothetical protein